MVRKTLLFAPCAFNLAETSRMLEIAKGIVRDPVASEVFESHFISDGGEFESLIEKHAFTLTRMEPRLTQEKIEHIAKVDRGDTVTSISVDEQSDLVLQTDVGVRDIAKMPNTLVPSRLTSTVRSRLYNSGNPVFVEVRTKASLIQFVARRPDSTPFLIASLQGKFRAASWNRFGLSAVVGDSLIIWEPGDKEVLQVLADKGLKGATDVCLVGKRRVVITLQNVALLATPNSLSVLLFIRSARCRFYDGSLYLLAPTTRLVWKLSGIDQIGDRSQDHAYALALLQHLAKPVDTSKPEFGEAARILSCRATMNALASTSGK